MAIKTFSIIKKVNLLTGEESIVRYALNPENEKRRNALLRKLARLDRIDEKLYSLKFDEVLPLHILKGISNEVIQELSRHAYPTCYVVSRRNKNGEKALYLSILKDTAVRYLISLPEATKLVGGKEVLNKNFTVKEIRLLV
ncbi:MAG: hypothetical protein KBT35_05495 [Firmicutes bacterium]|nr:hypothetical protein [Candidatus Colivicinus equi]